MAFGNFEGVIPISICFNHPINYLILKKYGKDLIHLMKILKEQVDNQKYKEELQIQVNSNRKSYEFFNTLFFPSNNLELDILITSKLLVIPERLENLYVLENNSNINYIEEFIHQKLEDFISKYDMKKLIEFILKYQYHNIFVDLTRNEKIILNKLSQLTPYGYNKNFTV